MSHGLRLPFWVAMGPWLVVGCADRALDTSSDDLGTSGSSTSSAAPTGTGNTRGLESSRGGELDGGDGDGGDASRLRADCHRSLEELLLTVADVHPQPDSVDFELPELARVQALEGSLIAGAHEDWARAASDAHLAGYGLCALPDDPPQHVWYPLDLTQGHTIVALRSDDGDTAPLILQHPHPFFDATLKGALPMWRASRARALVISGTHRCASTERSECDGTTLACDAALSAYRSSDPAHALGTTFDAAHRALATALPETVVVQLHGTSQDIAYVSDGTRGLGAKRDLVTALTATLAAEFPDTAVESCHFFDVSEPDAWLCGTNNIQGRWLNGSADVCTEPAQYGDGRFIHLEQPPPMRAAPETVAAAILAALQNQ